MHCARHWNRLPTARRLLLASTARRGGAGTAVAVSWGLGHLPAALPDRLACFCHVPAANSSLRAPSLPSCRAGQLPAFLSAAPRPLRHFQCTAVAQPPVRMGGGGGGGAAKRGGSGSDAGSSSQLSSQTAAQLQQERPHAPPLQAAEQQASSPPPPPPHQRPDKAAQLLPIAFADGQVTVGDGTLLLDRMTPLARVQHPAGTDMVLLSMQAAQGASSLEDFPLGRVRPIICWEC